MKTVLTRAVADCGGTVTPESASTHQVRALTPAASLAPNVLNGTTELESASTGITLTPTVCDRFWTYLTETKVSILNY